MSLTKQLLDYWKEIEENQKQIREMVIESCHSIELGKGRDCNEFFEEMEKRYENY